MEYAKFEKTRPIHKQEFIEKSEEALNKCLEFWKEEGVKLEAYNTSQNASDIDDLRIALGEEKISIWGLSY